MGIKSFFGKGLASLLQAHQIEANRPVDPRVSTDMERMFGNCTPALVAFKIENGYVVRAVNQEEMYEGKRQGGFTYCKDHQAIAEHIVASEAKRKLGISDDLYQREVQAAAHARTLVGSSGQFAQARPNRI
jgi:predicted GNAT family acetyltransferase